LDAKIADYTAKVKRYETEKAQIKNEAEGYQRDYDALNIHDDQFDMAEALMSISVAVFGITALTRKRSMLAVAACLAGLGALFGGGGCAGWNLPPHFRARLLG